MAQAVEAVEAGAQAAGERRLSEATLSSYMQQLGRIGGSSTSQRKQQASRANLAKARARQQLLRRRPGLRRSPAQP